MRSFAPLSEMIGLATYWYGVEVGERSSVMTVGGHDNLEDTAPMLGERVRTMRHFRHKTLDEVAGLVGISSSYLSLLERGRRPLDSRRLLYQLADVLECSIADLTGEPMPAVSTSHAAALATVRDIRLALASADESPSERSSRSAELLERDSNEALTLYMSCRYAESGQLLAPLIHDLAHQGSGDERISVTRTRAFFTAWSLTTSLGFLDLSLRAAEMAYRTAEDANEPRLVGVSTFAYAQALDRIGASPKSLKLCLRVIDQIQLSFGSCSSVRQACGTLHLHAAQTCAILGDRQGLIGEHAERSGPGSNFFQLYFGPTNVDLWRLAIAVELNEGGRGPRIVERINQEFLSSPNRRAYMYADLGRGLAQERRRDTEAITALCEAERIAPDLVRSTPLVRETVTDLLRRARRRAGGRNLNGLAYRMGVVHRSSVDL